MNSRIFGNMVRSIYGFIFLLLTLHVCVARADDAPRAATGAAAAAPSSGPDENSPASQSPAWHRVAHPISKGETLAGILRPLGVFGKESHFWFQAVGKHFRNGRLIPGQTIHLYFGIPPTPNAGGNLRAIQIAPKTEPFFSWKLVNQEIVFTRRKALFNEADAPGNPVQGGMAERKPAVAPERKPAIGVVPSAEPAREDPVASIERITHVVRRGETLAKIFRQMAVAPGEAQRWFRAVSRTYSVKRMRPGRRVAFYFTTAMAPDGASQGKQTLRGLQIETRGGKLLTWQKEGQRIAYLGRKNRLAGARATASRAAPSVSGKAARNPDKINGTNGMHGRSRPAAAPALESLERVTLQLARNQTFAAIVKPLGVSGVESQAWFLALQKNASTKNLKPGQKIEFYFAQTPAKGRSGNLRAIKIETGKGETYTWQLVGGHIYLGAKQVITLRPSPSERNSEIMIGQRPGGLRKLPLSEYTLARVKQRNGLSAHTTPATGHRPAASLEALERITKTVKPRDTLLGLLRPYGLDKEDEQSWLYSIQRNYVAEKLQPDSTVHVYFAGNNETGEERDPASYGRLKAFEIELPGDRILTWYESEHGILFYKSEPPYDLEVKAVAGSITAGSLYHAAARAGLHPQAISQLVDIFGWDINFENDLRKGDTFQVLYSRKFRPGTKEQGSVRVLAAEIVNRGRRHVAIYFENANGQGHYYDLEGRTVSRSLLRYPVEFRRISSSFSRRRYHPILRVRRPHRGVDFAAKRRTAVRTVGSGLVTYAGWKGAYGRFIEIDHGKGLKTRYAHLHRIGRGVRPGARVYKGQIIGSVGCSGRCTGPHLHFEMWRNNRYVNPLRTNSPPDDQLDPTVFKIFEEAKASFLAKLTARPDPANSSPAP